MRLPLLFFLSVYLHPRRCSNNSVINGSTDVLEYILSQEGCDVDPINRIDGATPLHLAVLLDHPGLRKHVVESLLDAGADTLCVSFCLSLLSSVSILISSPLPPRDVTSCDTVCFAHFSPLPPSPTHPLPFFPPSRHTAPLPQPSLSPTN